VNELLSSPLPASEEYDTISGMINNLFGRIPSLGEQYELEYRTISITKRKKQRVEQIKIEAKS
jgi:CBS domain containing-hemolysin-like protein